MSNRLRVHGVIPGSRVNGPGNRFVIWTQGCGKGCKGCFNPGTWPAAARGMEEWDIQALVERVLESGCDGVTLSGGDPLEQPEETLAMLQGFHSASGDLDARLPGGVILFTGYTIEEIEALRGEDGVAARACLLLVDLLIDGRYVAALKHVNTLSGSSNQRFHFSSRPGRGECRIPRSVSFSDFDQEVEMHGAEGGRVAVTGFPSLAFGVEGKRFGLKVLRKS